MTDQTAHDQNKGSGPRSADDRNDPGMKARATLLYPDWGYIEKPSLEDYRAADWALLNGQKPTYFAEEQAKQALELLSASKDAPTYGYEINNYQHCLQSATMALRDGCDEETLVVALFHDIGFIVCPNSHGEFSAAMLAPYISEANHWMLVRHAIFQQRHFNEYPDPVDRTECERWRGHPHFEWTGHFVENYDQNAIQIDYDNAPIEVFVPMVHRLFAREPRTIAID